MEKPATFLTLAAGAPCDHFRHQDRFSCQNEITTERVIHFHTGNYTQNVYSINFKFWISKHFYSDLSHNAILDAVPEGTGSPTL